MSPGPLTDLPYVVGPDDGLDLPLGRLGTVHKVPGAALDGRVAVVEHTLPARSLAAPLHRHSREDELSIVLAGEIGVLLGEDVVYAGPGSYVLKPRGQWHAFWSAGATELRIIELVVPSGFEVYCQRLAPLYASGADPAAITKLAKEYGIEFDFDSVPRLCERFGLMFG
jgi:mannose-6-phosphate isomerase-like protein (cupin superfamily)